MCYNRISSEERCILNQLNGKSLVVFLIALIAIGGFVSAPLNAADLFQNAGYGYEIEVLPDWTPDYSEYPDTMVWGIGDGGRLFIGVIQLDNEDSLPANEDYTAVAMPGLESNFDEFFVIDEAWSTSRNGLDVYDINFDCFINDETTQGTARVTIGTTVILSVYYDDPLDFEFYLPDISLAFESIRIDEALISADIHPDTPITGGPIEFINPLNILYKNEVFFYTCIYPPGLEQEEVTGPGWIAFSTGEGEFAIRYLDQYYNTGKTGDIFIGEMLPEIFSAFDRYEIIEEASVVMDDGREVSIFKTSAVFNGYDWTGAFAGFITNLDEPFMISLLAPVEEYERYAGGFDAMWNSFAYYDEY
jgi:hypothetical protein